MQQNINSALSGIDEDNPSPPDDGDSIPHQIDREVPTNAMELHRESSHPALAHNLDDEPPPSMDDDALVINATDTTEFHQESPDP